MAAVLFTCPMVSRRLDRWQANRLTAGDVDPLGDYQKFSGVAEQRCASQALAGAVVQEKLAGFYGCVGTMPRDHARVLEQSLEHDFGSPV